VFVVLGIVADGCDGNSWDVYYASLVFLLIFCVGARLCFSGVLDSVRGGLVGKWRRRRSRLFFYYIAKCKTIGGEELVCGLRGNNERL